MSTFGGVYFTNKGRALQAKALTGIQLNFTKVVIGDGSLTGQVIADLTALIHEVKTLAITTLKNTNDGKVTIGGVLTNQGLASGFYWRELGLFATDPDLGEILYCYGNAAALAEYIPAGGGADLLEKQINMIAIIGNATSVSATINNSLVFATYTDLSLKVDKVAGKVLSSNDYTTTEKNKLEGLVNYAHPSTHPSTMIKMADDKTLEQYKVDVATSLADKMSKGGGTFTGDVSIKNASTNRLVLNDRFNIAGNANMYIINNAYYDDVTLQFKYKLYGCASGIQVVADTLFNYVVANGGAAGNPGDVITWTTNRILDERENIFQTATGTSNAITLVKAPFIDGASVTFTALADNNGAYTTINGKSLYKAMTTSPPNLIAGKAYTIWFKGSWNCFFIKASAEGDVVASQVLAGKKFSNDNDTGLVGTMPNWSKDPASNDFYFAISAQASEEYVCMEVPTGFHVQGVRPTGAGRLIYNEPNFKASNLIAGKTYFGMAGGIPNWSNTDTFPAGIDGTYTVGRLYVRPQLGYHEGTQSVKVDDANFLASNIPIGKSMFGLAGTNTNKKWASGTSAVSGAGGSIAISNLSFQPSVIILEYSKSGYDYRAVYMSPTINSGFNSQRTYIYGGNFIDNGISIAPTVNGFTANISYASNYYNWVAYE